MIAAALISATLYSCSGDSNNVKLVEFSDWQSYTVVRSDTAGKSEINAVTTFTKAVEASTGVKPKLTTDWVQRGEEAPTGTKEILIGNTNRPESESELKYNDFVIKFENDRLVINGGSSDAIQAGVDWFVENCLDGGVYIPDGGYTYVGEYPLAEVKLGGILLSEFNVDGDTAFTEQASELQAMILNKTGSSPTSKEHSIKIETDESLSIFDAQVKLIDGDLHIAVHPSGLDIGNAIDIFNECLEKRTGDDISPDERKTIEMENVKYISADELQKWREESDAKIESILGSANMEIPEGSVVYYVSPNGNDNNDGKSPEKAWKTLDGVNSKKLEKGCYVCFERGGLWRGQLQAQPGVTYTAYGEGDKPKIYHSPFNGADASLWTKTDADNIWMIQLDKNDAGTVVFNDGEAHAIKCVIRTEADGSTYNNTTGEPYVDYHDLTTDLHFYHDYKETGILYLYSEQNPGERFDSIEFNTKQHCIAIKGNDITIDNFCIKYTGSHGIGAGSVENLTVTNCELGWIGGSIQAEGIYGRNYGTRFGNAIEIYGSCDTFTVTDNYIYQVYDAGITQQYTLTDADHEKTADRSQKNMTYARNVIEYCNYSIEYFLGIGEHPENPSRMENFLIEDNYMWYAGYGFSEQRPDGGAAHIKGWSGGNRNRATNYVIRNNYFVDTIASMVDIWSQLLNSDGSDSMPELINNNFAAHVGDIFGAVTATGDSSRKEYGAGVPEYLGDKSSGDIFWIEE